MSDGISPFLLALPVAVEGQLIVVVNRHEAMFRQLFLTNLLVIFNCSTSIPTCSAKVPQSSLLLQ